MSSENALLPRVWELERSLATAVRVNESLRQQLSARDAEIERLKTVPMRYRRMAFNAQLQNENTQLCQQLAAAHAARVSAQASGIRLLDQLTEAKEECDTLRRIHAENIAILERKTAQAVAACKLKDEALKHIALIDLGRDTLPTDFCMNVLSVRKALAIQPDDSTLRAWLGEPVAWRTFDGEGGYDFRSYDDNEDYRSKWDARNPNHKSWVELLYSPKGLK